MKNSHIEWTDHTFNPWIGCTKVSPGCANCYAETLNKRWKGGANWGAGAPRERTSGAYWREPLQWNRDVWAQCPKCGVKQPHGDVCIVPDCLTLGSEMQRLRPRVFCASLADALVPWLRNWLDGEAPANTWMGATVEDQKHADLRIPQLLAIPARVRFLSCEPLLEEVKILKFCGGENASVDWIICGGESGPGARPMHPDWARSLRDQCQSAGVAFFFKQWGRQVRGDQITFDGIQDEEVIYNDRFYTVTAKSGFRELDGQQWNEFPNIEVPA